MATKRAGAPSGLAEAKKRMSSNTTTEAPSGPTSASQWKKKTTEGLLVRVPSGNTALIRTPGMSVFLEAGVIPNALLPLIQDSMTRGAAPKDEDLVDLLKDKQKIQDIVDLASAVTVYCCIDPVVAEKPLDDDGNLIPIGDKRRDPDTLYVDEVDFNDKMFIFATATGGTEGLERFRQEQGLDVGVVQ